MELANAGAGPAIGCFLEGDVARDGHNGYTLLAERRLDREFQYARHLTWLGNELAIVAAVAEKLVGMRLLKIIASDFAAGDVRRNGENRHAVAMAIVESIDEMHIAGAPQLPAQTASSPVRWAWAPAAKAAVSSWRVPIHSMSCCPRMASSMPLSESPTTP